MRERHESVVEEQIRLAAERGAFDDLPGKGQPLRLDGPDDDSWWVRGWIEREGLSGDALLPTSLLLRKEIQRLPETVTPLPDEAAVRAVVSDLNKRVAAWQDARQGSRREVRHPVEGSGPASGTVEAAAADPEPGAEPMTSPTALPGPARAFRAIAIAEACSWTGLLVGMFFKYVVVFDDIGVKIFGPIHGALFVAYLVVTLVAARRLGWSVVTTLVALAASIPPLFTLWFERWAMRTGKLHGASTGAARGATA